MAKTIVGMFNSFEQAQTVVQDLVDKGFDRNDISLVANDAQGRNSNLGRQVGGDSASTAEEGAGAGAVGGTVIGGALGLLVGLGALAIPGIGPVIAAGPLSAAIGSAAAALGMTAAGAGIGAATGGLVGGLIGAGIPEEDATIYAEGVRRGGSLVMVNASDAMVTTASSIMNSHGAVNIENRSSFQSDSGWSGFGASSYDRSETSNLDTAASGTSRDWQDSSKVGTAGGTAAGAATGAAVGSVGGPVGTVIGGIAGAVAGAGVGAAGDVAGEKAEDASYDTSYGTSSFDSFNNDFRSYYQTNYANSGYTYDQYAPVFRYGYDIANDNRYQGDWAMIEPEARRSWEERNPGSWERFKDAVRYAWDRARGQAY